MRRELPLPTPPLACKRLRLKPGILPLLFLLLVLSARGAGAKGMADFFRPLTCTQHPSLWKPCGGKPERFYVGQCLQKKCCHNNGTCYHHAIDALRQRQNAGILGGVCAGAAGLFLCISIAWLKGAQAAGKEVKEPRSDTELADYLRKLLEESEEEEDDAEPKEEESKERGE